MSLMKELTKGVFKENPTFRLVLGMCPTLAVTTLAINGLGMGLSTAAVLIASNVVISLLRKFIPDKIRIPAFIIIIATFVTIVDMVLNAYAPALHSQLGIFVPLIVVNCIILGRAEAFASKSPVIDSIADGLGMGIGFTVSLTVIGAIRELLAAGTLFGANIMGAAYEPFQIIGTPPGGFIVLGLLMALVNVVFKKFRLE
ncbi:MAG TPA: electron transport complex subunit E [Firmicutes bacterium]|nr:electron transport complex subunit E [Bacillota bacterium]